MARHEATIIAVVACMALCGVTRADEAPRQPPYDRAREAVVAGAPAFFFKVALGTRSTAEARSDMAVALAMLDEGAKGALDADDARMSDLVRLAELRAAKVVAVLAYDRGNEGRVTRADVEATVRGASPSGLTDAQVGDRVGAVMNLDADHDGTIDYAEMRRLTDADVLNWTEGPVRQVLRAYGPGPVPVTAALARFDAFIAALDVDGDGTLSPPERALASPYDTAARRESTSRPPAER